MKESSPALPRARTQQLLSRELPDGLMVYDSARHRAHSLNQAAALVWQRCDGKTSVPELARLLHDELSLPVDEELVWLALSRLDKAGLLEDRLAPASRGSATSRRALLRKLGLSGGLALLLPVVTTIAAPRPAAAASGGTMTSCVELNGFCTSTAQCCDNEIRQCKLKPGTSFMICC